MAIRRFPGSRGLTVANAVFVVVLTACTGGGSDDSSGPTSPVTAPGTAATPPPGLSATVVQQRADLGTTRIGLEVTTDDTTSIHVDRVQLLSEAFVSEPATAKDTDFGPGQTIDLTVDYGRPVCDRGVTPADARVLVGYTQAADATERTEELPVKRLGLTVLGHLHTDECATRRLEEAASLTYGHDFHRQEVDGRLSLVGHLVLERPAGGGSGEPVTIESVLGSVLLELVGRDDEGPVVVLPRGQHEAAVPVLIRGNDRCHPHELSASQQTFVFTADVRVGGSSLHREIIEPPARLRAQAMALLGDVCR